MKKLKIKRPPYTKLFSGWIALRNEGEAYDILFVGGTKSSWLSNEDNRPLAERVQDLMMSHGDFLSIRYWVSDKEQPLEEVQEEFLMELMGAANADYGHHYSELTGYLWTDEELMVGGHDLLKELKSHKDRFLHLEITFSQEEPIK